MAMNEALKDPYPNVFIPYDQKCRLCGETFRIPDVWKQSWYCNCCRDRIGQLGLPMKGILEHLLSRIERLEAEKPRRSQ